MVTRQFASEGGLHLYSSQPTVFCPADLYCIDNDHGLRSQLVGCNLYLVTCRRRILIDPSSVSLDGPTLTGTFVVPRTDRWERVPFRYPLRPEHIETTIDQVDVATSESGTHVLVVNPTRKTLVASHVLVAESESALTAEDRDLDVLYVGKGLGRIRPRLAVDRLLRHETLQHILADFHTHHPQSEILLLLFRFEHSRNIISNGGDLNLEPMASLAMEAANFEKMTSATFDRVDRIALAEAALINHFKPTYNQVFKHTDFEDGKKLKTLKVILNKGLTGLIVEICTANIRSRLRTQAMPARDIDREFPEMSRGYRRLVQTGDDLGKQAAEQWMAMQHTHNATFALTSKEERETFLHGTCWIGETERQPFL